MCAYPSRHYTQPRPNQDMAAPRGPSRLARSRVTKTLQPGQPGTTRWQHAYGDHLVCVRYREDLQANARYVTVELVVETRPLRRQPPPPIIRANALQPGTLVQHAPSRPELDAPPPDPWEDWTASSVPPPQPRQPAADTPPARVRLPHPSTAASPPAATPSRPPGNERVYVHIGDDEQAVRTIAQRHGARWDPTAARWHMLREKAEQLDWQSRISPL